MEQKITLPENIDEQAIEIARQGMYGSEFVLELAKKWKMLVGENKRLVDELKKRDEEKN